MTVPQALASKRQVAYADSAELEKAANRFISSRGSFALKSWMSWDGLLLLLLLLVAATIRCVDVMPWPGVNVWARGSC